MSVEATILERKGKVQGAIYTTASILDTVQMQAMGGLMAAKHIWEGAIVPSLLAGAGTWVGCTTRQEEMCKGLLEQFWRTVPQVPKGTPKVMYRAETVSRKMKLRIWKQKVLLDRKIRSQDRGLAKAILEEQVAMGWPGLAKEVAEICEKIGLKNASKEMISKEELEEAIFHADYKEMKSDMEKYSKLKEVMKQE